MAGRFELIDRIGAGGAGAVWRAFDRGLRRECAAKLVRHADLTELIRVLRELGVRLDHPHVLSPYAWAAEDDVVVIATGLVRGGSLVSLIRDYGALPWRYVAEILSQLLSALDHVHAAGLVHRDVKPANVLLTATGLGAPHVLLSDFGIAHATDDPRVTRTGFVVGTLGYLAPEALAGRWPHPSQDLFAAGVLGRQLLTGEERPPVRTGKDSPLWTVLSVLLADDPDRRFGARALLDNLRATVPLALPALTADGEPIEIFDLLAGGISPP